MAEEVKQICDELKASEGDEAMDACHNKTLPPVKEKSTAEDSTATPLDVIPLQSQVKSIQPESESQRSEPSMNEGVNLQGGYQRVIGDRNSQQRRSGTDPPKISPRKLPLAPGRHLVVRSKLQRTSTDDCTSTAESFPPGFSDDESSTALSPELMTGVGPPISSVELPLDRIGPSSSSMETSFNEAALVDVTVMASSQMEEPNSPQQQLAQLSDEDIASFCNVTGRNENIAIYCLTLCNGDVEKAIGYCFDQGFPMEFLEDVTSEPTEESGDANVTVAIPTMASSFNQQVDKSIVDEDDSSAETNTVPVTTTTTTTIEIRLVDGTTLKISLRSDQTVRDIRKAMEELRPDITRENYSLTSVDNGDCSDLNRTIEKIASDGYATLIQMFLD